MSLLFRKLNLSDQREILVIDAPQSFESELKQIGSVNVIRNPNDIQQIGFAIYFVQSLNSVTKAVKTLEKAPDDPVIWFAYPKGTSKNYSCEFNRDTGWQSVGEAGLEGVRQVAIDADWSALRFRRVEHIKSLKRNASMAISKAGKRRTREKS